MDFYYGARSTLAKLARLPSWHSPRAVRLGISSRAMVVLAGTMLSATSCSDIVSPERIAPLPGAPRTGDVLPEAPATASATVNISGGPTATMDVPILSASIGALYDYVLTGNVSATDDRGTHDYGLAGHPSGIGRVEIWRVSVDNGGTSHASRACCATGISETTARGRLELGPGDFLRLVGGGLATLDGTGFIPFAGSATLAITRVPAILGIGTSSDASLLDSIVVERAGVNVDLRPWGTPREVAALVDSTTWLFTPDDGTVPYMPCNEWYQTSSSCQVTVTKSGVITARGSANGGGMIEARPIRIGLKQNATLLVECLPALVSRGGPIACSARTSEGALTSVIGWEFTSSDSGLAQQVTVKRTTSVTAISWNGIAAVSGTVTVKALVGGVQQTQTSSFKVAPTTFATRSTPHQEVDLGAASLPDPPTKQEQLGFMRPIVEPSPDILKLLAPIASGPNTGFAFLSAMPVKLVLQTAVNTTAMRENSAFWKLQVGGSGNLACPPEIVTSLLLPGVHAHEGHSIDDRNSHVQTFYEAFEFNFNVAVANIVRFGAIEESELSERLQTARERAMNGSDAITHSESFNPERLPCNLVYAK